MKITQEQRNILQTAAAQLKRQMENREKQQEALTAINEFSRHIDLVFSNKLDPTPEEVRQYFEYCLGKVREAKEYYSKMKLPAFEDLNKLLNM